VTAKDKGTGKEQNITIQGSGSLDKEEVEKMAKEAEAHAEEDKAKKEAVEARNHLDSAVYQAEKLKGEEKVSDDDEKTIDEAVEKAKKVVADEKADKDALEAATKELNDVLMPIGAKMYEQAAKEAEAEAPGEAASEETSSETKKDKKKKDDKDAPIEGEVVD
jgi:molecular chaperone DnaK